jgi:hypothetical protein
MAPGNCHILTYHSNAAKRHTAPLSGILARSRTSQITGAGFRSGLLRSFRRNSDFSFDSFRIVRGAVHLERLERKISRDGKTRAKLSITMVGMFIERLKTIESVMN